MLHHCRVFSKRKREYKSFDSMESLQGGNIANIYLSKSVRTVTIMDIYAYECCKVNIITKVDWPNHEHTLPGLNSN